MFRNIAETIRSRGLLQPGDLVVVAVSGGADSVALLYALHHLRRPLGVALAVAHLDHGIRGRAGAADAAFVLQLAWKLGLPCITGRADVPALARRSKMSLEMAAREARYLFLAGAARELGATCVATAHTSDDQVETVVLRLARGAGSRGLAGIPFRTVYDGVPVIRPMREVPHAWAVDFLRRHGLKWREDRTNRELRFLRNRVRHKVLPFLEEQLSPRLREALQRTSDIIAGEDEWMDAEARKALGSCRTGSAALSVRKVRQLPLAMKRRVLRAWLVDEGVAAERLDYDLAERVERLLAAKGGTRVAVLPGGRRVVRVYDSLRVERVDVQPAGGFRAVLKIPGTTKIAEAGLRIEASRARGILRARGAQIGRYPVAATVSLAAVGKSPVLIRSWRPGDRIRPLGMEGSKKIQDVLTDLKVPAADRGRVPIFECRGEIIWLPGYRVARGWEVPSPDSPCLRLRMCRA